MFLMSSESHCRRCLEVSTLKHFYIYEYISDFFTFTHMFLISLYGLLFKVCKRFILQTGMLPINEQFFVHPVRWPFFCLEWLTFLSNQGFIYIICKYHILRIFYDWSNWDLVFRLRYLYKLNLYFVSCVPFCLQKYLCMQIKIHAIDFWARSSKCSTFMVQSNASQAWCVTCGGTSGGCFTAIAKQLLPIHSARLLAGRAKWATSNRWLKTHWSW